MNGMTGYITGWMIWTVAALYFVPTIVAACRGLRNRGSILVLNLFLGWSFVAWVLALAWSVSGTAERQ